MSLKKAPKSEEIFGQTISQRCSCFLLYFFGVGTKLRFLFKSLKVVEEKDCFDKFITFFEGSDLYLILFSTVLCMPIVFPLFLG